jgi:hypothetical protein
LNLGVPHIILFLCTCSRANDTKVNQKHLSEVRILLSSLGILVSCLQQTCILHALFFFGVSDDHKSYRQWDESSVIEAYQTPPFMCSNFNYGSSGTIDLPVSVLLSHEYDFFHLPAPLLNFLQCFPIHDAMNICISANGIASAQVPVLSWRFRSGFGP